MLKKLAFLLTALLLVAISGLLVSLNIKGNRVTHDGSRTGPRVSYQSYCDPEGGYVIYENEKIPFTTDEGEQVYWTKDDIECYKNRNSALLGKTDTITPTSSLKPVQKTNSVVDNDPIVDCVSSYPNCKGQTIKLKQSQCANIYCCVYNDGKASLFPSSDKCVQPTQNSQPSYSYTPKTYYSCTLCYHYSYGDSCSTYNNLYETKELCDAEQTKIDSIANTYTTPSVTPQPTVDPNIEIAHQNECNQAVQDWIAYKESFYANEYNNFNSSYEAMTFLENARQQYQAILNSYGCSNKISL